jgi:hypothetical protein
MHRSRLPLLAAIAVLLALPIGPLACRAREGASSAKDPLAAEAERSSAILQSHTETQGVWAEVKKGSHPILSRAEEDLRAGRRVVAVHRLAAVKMSLATASYLGGRSAESKDLGAFEAEWTRMGGVLRDQLAKPSPTAFEGVEPAAVRALGEAALPQVRIYYESSLDYGRSSMPGDGLYYLASAQAQRETVSWLRDLATPSERRTPPLRALAAELDGLEADILKAYRPPASIDRHREFIGASSVLKEARELDAAGLRYGALLRYLQAAQRIAPLRQDPPAPGADEVVKRLAEFDQRLAAGGFDHSLGRLFLEIAQADLADAADTTPPSAAPLSAVIIAGDVLPRYFAALEPARPAPQKPEPQVTVTLVRWPYT